MGGYNEQKESSLNIDYFEIIPKAQRGEIKIRKGEIKGMHIIQGSVVYKICIPKGKNNNGKKLL